MSVYRVVIHGKELSKREIEERSHNRVVRLTSNSRWPERCRKHIKSGRLVEVHALIIGISYSRFKNKKREWVEQESPVRALMDRVLTVPSVVSDSVLQTVPIFFQLDVKESEPRLLEVRIPTATKWFQDPLWLSMLVEIEAEKHKNGGKIDWFSDILRSWCIERLKPVVVMLVKESFILTHRIVPSKDEQHRKKIEKELEKDRKRKEREYRKKKNEAERKRKKGKKKGTVKRRKKSPNAMVRFGKWIWD